MRTTLVKTQLAVVDLTVKIGHMRWQRRFVEPVGCIASRSAKWQGAVGDEFARLSKIRDTDEGIWLAPFPKLGMYSAVRLRLQRNCIIVPPGSEYMTETANLWLVLHAMHFDDVSPEVIKPWPVLLGRRTALNAAFPVSITISVGLVDRFLVPVKVVDSFEVLPPIDRT